MGQEWEEIGAGTFWRDQISALKSLWFLRNSSRLGRVGKAKRAHAVLHNFSSPRGHGADAPLPTLRLVLRLERRLRRGEAGDGDAERRAGNVVQADLLTEIDRGRIAAVLAADAELQGASRIAATGGCDPHQLADAVAV